MPLQRPNAIAKIGSRYLIGGLGGLYLGQPGAWSKVSGEPVRQLLPVQDGAWIVYGSGAVDRIEPETDRLYPDVLFGSARRPWASCAALLDGVVAFGGQGGWIEHGNELTDLYPPELDGDVVMAIAGRGNVRWIGTQKSGLFEFERGRVLRWNPGNGLSDPWVTCLQMTSEGLVVGTATKGLFLLRHGQIRPVDSPTQRVTKLLAWRGKLVVGGMDGAWVGKSGAWKALQTGGEETTSLQKADGRLVVTTAAGAWSVDL
jgi:hypothetical protein